MSLNDYFEPVSLERSSNIDPSDQGLFCHNIYIHTPDNPIRDIASFQIAIIGVPENRGCSINGVDMTPDIVREKLYQLSSIEKNPRIIDLGNLRNGKEQKDTYFGLRDVILELLTYNILPIIIGGSQDLTYGAFLAFEYLQKPYTLTTVDNRIDVAFDSYDKITFRNYLNSVILENKHLFEYVNIGQQACFASSENSDLFENLFFESIRLGNLRNNLIIAEPYLRDSTIMSIDFSSIRNADAPGQLIASPNGFNAEDICQIARYAGFGEGLKLLGLFDISPIIDNNLTTCSLAAQTIWYFLDGFAIRINENPSIKPDEFKNHIVSFDELNTMVFFKSFLTQRWWCEVPVSQFQNMILDKFHSD